MMGEQRMRKGKLRSNQRPTEEPEHDWPIGEIVNRGEISRDIAERAQELPELLGNGRKRMAAQLRKRRTIDKIKGIKQRKPSAS